MAVLTIEGTEYDVTPLTVGLESMVRVRRAFSGALRSVETADGSVRSFLRFPFETGVMSESEADTLQAALNAADTVDLTGDLPGTITVKAVEVRRIPGPLKNEASIQFLAREVGS